MAGANTETSNRDYAEANSQLDQLNASVDQIKSLDQQITDKRLSTNDAVKQIKPIFDGVMNRLLLLEKLSDINPAMVVAFAKAGSILNRIVAFEPDMALVRDAFLQKIQARIDRMPKFNMAGNPFGESLNTLGIAKSEAALLNFKGSPKDFFENPKFKEMATQIQSNFMSFGPETMVKLSDIVSQYFKVNGQPIPQGGKMILWKGENNKQGFAFRGSNGEMSATACID